MVNAKYINSFENQLDDFWKEIQIMFDHISSILSDSLRHSRACEFVFLIIIIIQLRLYGRTIRQTDRYLTHHRFNGVDHTHTETIQKILFNENFDAEK